MDRAQLSELLFRFARALDTKDFDAYVDLYVEVTGNRASSRSYLQAVHVGSNLREHWSAGGWYDCEYRRTESGWKFVRVRLTAVWLSGEPGEIRPEPSRLGPTRA